MSSLDRLNQYPMLRAAVLFACGVIVVVFIATIGLNILTRHGQHKIVPDFTGVSVEEAVRLARRGDVSVEVIDSLFVPSVEPGAILDQNPAPETAVKAGRRVFVTINAQAQRKVQIPYVTGFSLRQARNMLEVAGLEVGQVVYRPDMANDYVLEERFEGVLISRGSREMAELGSGITLVVGRSGN